MLMIMLLISCFCVVLSTMLHIEPVNIVENRFRWLGDQNWVFGWVRIREPVEFFPTQMNAHSSVPLHGQASIQTYAQNLKLVVRSSELFASSQASNFQLSSIRSLKRAASVQTLKLRLFGRSSE